MPSLQTIFWLGVKELRSFLHDVVLLGLVIWQFSFSVYTQAESNAQELHNAAVAIVDEDNSPLSRRIAAAFLPPYFSPPVEIAAADADRLMNTGRFTFVIDFPPHFERDTLAGRDPAAQVLVDATALMQAGIGAGYIEQILDREVAGYISRADAPAVDPSPVALTYHVLYNPNALTAWFTSVMAIINSVTMLGIILAGAAVVREREHGTMDHLLVMPVRPLEIALAKIWANALVITTAAGLSLALVIRLLLHVPVAGSIPLFLCGVALYLFFTTAVGIFLGTVARSMPQLGLLFILTAVPMMLLSGGNTPPEAMPPLLDTVMQACPSTHFVSFATAILYRGAGFSVVWPQFVAVVAIGGLFLGLALLRFRQVSAQVA